MHQCNICGEKFQKFIPYRNGLNGISLFQKKLDIIGSNVENFGCPKCGCHDRERHLILYLEKLGILSGKKRVKILHFAPEKNIVSWLSLLEPELHIFADLNPVDFRYECLDIEKIPYSDNSFDLVIANHVLEHVNSPFNALREINRVLCDDGYAILQTPFSQYLTNDFEDESIEKPGDRLFFYGQEDHSRVFGKNLILKISEFLVSNVIYHEDIFDENVANFFGVNSREPLFLFGKKKVESQKKDCIDSSLPLISDGSDVQVSICCLAYNHQDFIAETLFGFLRQKTSFKYEIVVGEDDSTDETRKIIQDISLSYPGRIRLLPRKRNMGMHQNLIRSLKECKGKYVALCEGDDYWLDENKLMKQWAFLEQNKDYVLDFSAAQAQINKKLDLNYLGALKRDLLAIELIVARPVNTLTVMFRNILLELPSEITTAGACDLFLWSLLGHYGKGHYNREILPSVYRIHPGGVHSMKSHNEKLAMRIMTFYSLFLYYKRINIPKLADFFMMSLEADCRAIRLHDKNGLELIGELPNKMRSMARGAYQFDASELIAVIKRLSA